MFAPGPGMSCEEYKDNSKLVADILVVYCWSDNFGYVIVDRDTNECAFVDATEDKKFEKVLKEKGLTLKYVLTTHHHNDHSAGNHYWRSNYPDVPVVGGVQKAVPNANMSVNNGDKLTLGNLTINCIHVPCHTSGHVAYHITSNDTTKTEAVFTGDFLFYAGCGKFFEGTGQDMTESIERLYSTVKDHSCQMFSGHEYAVPNLKFASLVLPQNHVVQNALVEANQRIELSIPNVGSSLEQERGHNPFVKAALDFEVSNSEFIDPLNKCSNNIELVSQLRKAKDNSIFAIK